MMQEEAVQELRNKFGHLIGTKYKRRSTGAIYTFVRIGANETLIFVPDNANDKPIIIGAFHASFEATIFPYGLEPIN